MDLRNRQVTIMGLGRHGGGVAAARYCAHAGAIMTVTDLADSVLLKNSLAMLSDVPISKLTLEEHREEDFRSADVLVVNPAVKPNDPHVERARQTGAVITSEVELFLNACPARVIGVTGTLGKSTTAAMLTEILKAADRRAWLGGNIGHSLLNDLPRISADDIVVLELSSFQLHWLSDAARWPQAAVVTNCMPNHLDWHGNWEHYAASKQRLLSHLPAAGFAVLNDRDVEVSRWIPRINSIIFCSQYLKELPVLRVPGEHNRINAACAVAAAKALAVKDSAIVEALKAFSGLSHRLCFVAEIEGRRFYNDSKSTAPAATIAALNAMDRPTWLILGGANRQIEVSDFAQEVMPLVQGVGFFGAMRQKLSTSFRQIDKELPRYCGEMLSDALAWCWQQSKPGDAILLSPGCPSTDQYRDFIQRGEEFEAQVQNLRGFSRSC